MSEARNYFVLRNHKNCRKGSFSRATKRLGVMSIYYLCHRQALQLQIAQQFTHAVKRSTGVKPVIKSQMGAGFFVLTKT